MFALPLVSGDGRRSSLRECMSTATTILLYELRGLALIVPSKTGVVYRNQTGGHACYQTEIEGYLVPIADDRQEIVDRLCSHFTGSKWGGWCAHGIDDATADEIDELLTKPGNMSKHIKIGLVILCAALVVLVPYFVMNGHAVSLTALAQLSESSTQYDVEQFLGPPTNTYATEKGFVWVYSGSTWCIVTVAFKQDGTVDSMDHDH